MPATMEDTVDFLLNQDQNFRLDQPRVTKKDRKLLLDISKRSWWMSEYPALSERQQQLVQSIVSRYLMLLKLNKWPVEDLATPVWKKPARPTEIINYTMELNPVTQLVEIQFPYDIPLIKLMRDLSERYEFLGQLEYDRERRLWTALPTEQTLNLIRHLIAKGNWYRSEEITQLLKDQTEAQVPQVNYINGDWQFLHMPEHLQDLCEQVVQTDESLVTQAFDLQAHGVQLNPSVAKRLASWLRPEELDILVQPQRGIEPVRLAALVLLMEKVNRWPVVVLNNPYDPDQNVLEHLTWPADRLVRYRKVPQQLEHRVPWIVSASSLYLTTAYARLYRYTDRWVSVGNVII